MSSLLSYINRNATAADLGVNDVTTLLERPRHRTQLAADVLAGHSLQRGTFLFVFALRQAEVGAEGQRAGAVVQSNLR